jgi:hypothetical protein
VRLLLFERVSRLLLNTTRWSHELVGSPLIVVVFPWSVQDRRAGIKAALTNTNVLGVFFHLLHILIVFPPVDKLGNRPSVLMLVSHAACDVWTGCEAIVLMAVGTVRRGVMV